MKGIGGVAVGIFECYIIIISYLRL